MSNRFHIADVLAEGSAGITRRAGRSFLTALGTTLGVAALVATLGLTTTAGAQISRRFDILQATEVDLRDSGVGITSLPPFPQDTEQRLTALNGVRAAGMMWTVSSEATATTRAPSLPESSVGVPLVAMTAGALDVVRPTILCGRLFGPLNDDRGDRVVLVGSSVARELGIPKIFPPRMTVYVQGRPFTVIGVMSDMARHPELLFSMIVPASSAADIWGTAGVTTKQVVIDTELGAAQLVGNQAPAAVNPRDPNRLLALVPPAPRSLQAAVESDVDVLFLLLAAVSVMIGAISIANTTYVSVIERDAEVGLRRAMGASRSDIALQFLAESALLGLGGGIAGTSLGVVCVVVVSAFRQWTPIMEPLAIVVGSLLGVVVGLAAGLYPAVKASRIEPVDSLRR